MAMRLADTLYRVPRQPGLHLIHKRGAGEADELTSWRLCLEAGASERFECPGEETILVLQQGSGSFQCGDDAWPVSRRGVFEEPASSLYLPPGTAVDVRADSALEAIVISTPVEGSEASASGGGPVFLPPSSVKISQRGEGSYRRTIHDLLVHDDYAQRLLVGETFNPPGHWSSFPPHKHDGGDGEAKLEEVYHYRVDPPQGFALQLLYTRDGESVAHTVRDGDAVLLPYGYHPVAAPPGYQVCYLWALSGEVRRLTLFEDPDHRWIHEA